MTLADLKTGHRLDPNDTRDRPYRDHADHAGAPLLPSDDVDLRDDLPEVREQIAQDCCAHAVADAVTQDAATRGVVLDEPSRLFLYDVALLEERPKQPLVDAGCGLRWMFKGMKERGLTTEKRWPEIPENINVVPPDDCWRAAEEGTIGAYSAISDGSSSADEAIAALRRRRVSTVCMRVDQKFTDTLKAVYDGAGGQVIGSHCMLVVGFSTALDAFLIRNSWGKHRHDGGYVWVSRRFYNLYTYGKWIVEFGTGALS